MSFGSSWLWLQLEDYLKACYHISHIDPLKSAPCVSVSILWSPKLLSLGLIFAGGMDHWKWFYKLAVGFSFFSIHFNRNWYICITYIHIHICWVLYWLQLEEQVTKTPLSRPYLRLRRFMNANMNHLIWNDRKEKIKWFKDFNSNLSHTFYATRSQSHLSNLKLHASCLSITW